MFGPQRSVSTKARIDFHGPFDPALPAFEMMDFIAWSGRKFAMQLEFPSARAANHFPLRTHQYLFPSEILCYAALGFDVR